MHHQPNVPPSKRLLLLCAVTAGLAALELLSFAFGTRESRRQQVPLRREISQASPLRANPDFPAHDTTAALSTVQRVLPDVPGPVTDWRKYQPETITVSPYPGLALPFHRVRVSVDRDVTTWVGRNGLRGASLVGIGKRDRWFGVLSMIGGSFDISIHGSNVKVTEHSGPFTCGAVPAPRHHSTQNNAALESKDNALSSDAVSTVGDPSIHVSGSAIYTVDVAFFYSQDAEQYSVSAAGTLADVPSYLDARFRSYIATNNLILEQSKVGNVRWHFVGIYRVPDYTPKVYDHGGDNGVARYDMGFDFSQMTDTATATGRYAADKSALVQSDQEVFLVGNWRNVAGLGNQPGYQCILDITDDTFALAHEMGHNFGIGHDRDTDQIPDSELGYNFGYSFQYNTGDFGGTPYKYKICDVMGYGAYQPFYSNPEVFVTGSQIFGANITQSDNARHAMGIGAGQIRAADGSRVIREGASAMAAHRNAPNEVFPSVFAQPVSSESASFGGHVHLGVAASGTNLSYQWRKNGANLAGAIFPSLDLPNASAADAGTYDVVVTNVLGSVITQAAAVTVSSQPAVSRVANISTRSIIGVGDNVQIAGFVVSGSSTKTVLIRASGPALTALGVSGALADPVLELHSGASILATNDDWSSEPAQADAIRTAGATVGAFTWANGSKDAAIIITLNPGTYSAIVSGKNSGIGVALVEVYEISPDTSTLVNISTRSAVGVGDNVQIAGFVIGGATPKTVLIRASGPALTGLGVSAALADPVLELHSEAAILATNDNWSSDPTKADAIRTAGATVGAFTWTNGSKDAAILVTLNPGVYSAVISDKNGGTGVALVEVYDASAR
jgi:hypothetical protein